MSDQEKQKPTLDERIEALVHSMELFQLELHAERQQRLELEAQQRQADLRERKGRQAILIGIAAYLKALEDGEEPK